MSAAMSAVAFPYGGFDGRCGQDRKAGTAHRRQRPHDVRSPLARQDSLRPTTLIACEIDIRGGFTHALGRLSDSQRLCILDVPTTRAQHAGASELSFHR